MNTGSVQTLIVLREEEHAWLQDLFRSRHPMLVTLCNKPFIEYLIDFAILSGSEALRIASDSPITDLENYCRNGSRWGITIDYAHILPEDDQERLLEKNRQFCSRGKTMLIEKTLFVAYDKKTTTDYGSGPVRKESRFPARADQSPSWVTNKRTPYRDPVPGHLFQCSSP
ncbi:hypothetical protein [Chlorobium phaeovibrioides]|uniref:hypothetical protein n=1 Tax=Chlorobium phaeovibrioides TaxID=1094 RepID=UPI0012312A13|nr:hypothetical protein [Chlorobium phaeovibrioides]QEQ57656.1 hypothetical protein FNV82_09135 [Chlorobium phaeovibrioides]